MVSKQPALQIASTADAHHQMNLLIQIDLLQAKHVLMVLQFLHQGHLCGGLQTEQTGEKSMADVDR